ncbi:MAG: 4a-hydroxytetrahydrobiopterin dehydratase [Silvibacterium sp.]|nr:4a-hydroxytetrahydrobiopterin dehydratase [Silvibacterium sp.]MBV8437000.1 4a-hydroxytetrahydrobiopterin dehydratase [Silvibacterium sp.]
MPLLDKDEVQERLSSLPDWRELHGEIVRQLEFPDFVAAMEFVNSVAAKAEAAGHHPDIDIRYNKVRLALVSHDAGGLTQRDFDLAASIDSLLD